MTTDPLPRWNVEYLTPLTRFVKRSRVKPTDGQIEHALGLITNLRTAIADADARVQALRAELEQLQQAVKAVVETFSRDEAQGFRSRDRQFAIEILGAALRS
jgi:hypothetical protein